MRIGNRGKKEKDLENGKIEEKRRKDLKKGNQEKKEKDSENRGTKGKKRKNLESEEIFENGRSSK